MGKVESAKHISREKRLFDLLESVGPAAAALVEG
jgi:hypothetical protein